VTEKVDGIAFGERVGEHNDGYVDTVEEMGYFTYALARHSYILLI
jgi:hypothetical protein